jgi:hypothetical protein
MGIGIATVLSFPVSRPVAAGRSCQLVCDSGIYRPGGPVSFISIKDTAKTAENQLPKQQENPAKTA